ncbi:hypothetical protein BGX28_001467 [Mortierella sp. GBA30]|nr:hypothetical protein BGX28_001467 [Mortierella sp. GBA30]
MSVAATNTFNYLASPSVSPSPSMVGSRISEWTIPLSSSADNDTSDLEMASPTASPPSSPYAPQFSGKPHSSTSRGGHGDITTRTIKKLKSLRRAHTTTSTSSTRQSALHQYQQQQPPQEGRPAREESREISAALTVNNYRLSMTSTAAGGGATVGASSNPPLLPVPTGTHSQGVKDKPKFMKRSKTIVFRPEVTMQPLSSKNVIPPWNRIPSVITPNISTTSPNSTTAATGTRTPTSSIHSPISPVSPTTPVSGGNHHPFMAFFSSNVSPKNAMIVGESATATTPTYKDPEERPRKLAMSQSKTMPSLALWSMDGSASAKGPSSPRSPVSANPFHSNISEGNSTVRALLTSSYSATTLIAPWNRANSSSETNTHLHSLIKVSSSSSSGQASASLLSPAELPSVPVELGRSFQKKDFNQQQRSLQQSQAVLSKTNKEHSPIPVLSHPPECRNRSGTTSNRQITNSPGMSHSVSAPGGFLPLMTISKPTADSTNKRRPTRRESTTGVLTPTKQPVGILKNAQQSIIGARKSSLTVPGTAMFPVQPPSPSTPTFGLCHHPHGPSVVTTFKIVMDADTIVALQVIEDRKFILTLDDLKTRVKSKLLKSNIQLPEAFDLFWNMPSTAPSTPSTPLSVSTVSSLSSPTSGVTLRNDEDLHRAIHSSKNHKVTLRCIF